MKLLMDEDMIRDFARNAFMKGIELAHELTWPGAATVEVEAMKAKGEQDFNAWFRNQDLPEIPPGC